MSKTKKQLTAEQIQAKKEQFEKDLANAREKAAGMNDKQKLAYIPCWKHTGKMKDIVSMSSSSEQNPDCIARVLEAEQIYNETGIDIVCRHCFSNDLQEQYSTMKAKYVVATEILTSKVFAIEDFPLLNAAIARLESFGDILPLQFGGMNQGLNYIHYVKRNPDTTFACWTKNPMTWQAVFQVEEKPENMIMIYSDPVINGSMEEPEQLEEAIKIAFPFIDKIFIVYDKAYVKTNKVDINCGARSCNACRRCYRKYTESIIKEQLK